MEFVNLIDIKNRIYRIKTLMRINEINNFNDSFMNNYKYINIYKSIINICNTSILKDNEIKKKLIDISIKFLKTFINNKEIIKDINKNIINRISDNKITIILQYTNNNNYYSNFEIFRKNRTISPLENL